MTQYIQLSRKAHNLAGQRFGRLLVLGAITSGARVYWHCRCDCGNDTNVRADSLRNGAIVSCGCQRLESVTTHGMHSTAIYRRWSGILARCFDPKNKGWERYGGRGITICEAWQDFQTFHDYVSKLSHFGEKGYTLDRIDNDGNYEPGNVKWSTAKQQQRNRRGNHFITANGVTRTLHEWAEVTGLATSTIFNRIKAGWSPEDTVTLSPDKGRRHLL